MDAISITELLSAVLRRGKTVLLCMLIPALLLGGVQMGRKLLSAGYTMPDEKQMAAYEREKTTLEKQMSTLEDGLLAQQAYMDNSLLMQIDPYDTWTGYIDLTIAEVDEAYLQRAGIEDMGLDYVTSRISSRYISLFNSCSLPEELALKRYENTPDELLRELITVSSDSAGMVHVMIFADSMAASEELTDAVYRFFLAQEERVAANTCAHHLMLLNSSVRQTNSSIISELQRGKMEGFNDMQATKEDQTDRLRELEQLMQPVATGRGAAVKSGVKFAIVGAILGAGAACCVIWWGCFFGGRLESSYQIERECKLPFIGALRAGRGLFGRWADRLVRERTWSDPQQAAAYAAEKLRVMLGESREVLFVSSARLDEDEALCSVMKTLEKDGIKARFIQDLAHDPAAIGAVRRSTGLVLAERIGVSHLSDMRDAMALVERADKSFVGFILL